jgi:hypothetical protein
VVIVLFATQYNSKRILIAITKGLTFEGQLLGLIKVMTHQICGQQREDECDDPMIVALCVRVGSWSRSYMEES